jgi:hypothetical protein
MGINLRAKMKRIQQLKNWDEAERLWDEVLSQAGLTTEAQKQAQRDLGTRIASAMNAKSKQGKKI